MQRYMSIAAVVMALSVCAGWISAQTSGTTGGAATQGSVTKWTNGANAPVAGNVTQGTQRHPCLQIDIKRLAANTTPAALIYFSVNQFGTLGTFWIDLYELWLDNNRDGKLDSGDTLLMQSTDGQFYNPPFTPGAAPPAGTTWIMPGVQPGQTVSLLVTVDVNIAAPVGDTVKLMCTSNGATGLNYLQFDPVEHFAPSMTWNGYLIGGFVAEPQTVDAFVPPDFSPGTAPDATVGDSYDLTLDATGGIAPYAWNLSTGALPPGLSLVPGATSAEMHISGTPTTVGTYAFDIHLVDSTGYNATHSYSLNVLQDPNLVGQPDLEMGGGGGSAGCIIGEVSAWPVLLLLPVLLALGRRRRA